MLSPDIFNSGDFFSILFISEVLIESDYGSEDLFRVIS